MDMLKDRRVWIAVAVVVVVVIIGYTTGWFGGGEVAAPATSG